LRLNGRLMSLVNIYVTGQPSRRLSRSALLHYLRWGFVPSPLHLDASLSAENLFSEFPKAAHYTGGPRYRHDLVGHRQGVIRDQKSALDEFSTLLIQETSRAIEGFDDIYLMASGGKDSLSIAWALSQLGQKCTLVHCRDYLRDDESVPTREAAALLGHDYLEIETHLPNVNDFLRERSSLLSLPIADVAFFPYVAAVLRVEQKQKAARNSPRSALLLDGMGNDAYMGHIPGGREKRLLSLPRCHVSESLISYFYGNNYIHYGLEILSRYPYERHFSGAGFSVKGLSHDELQASFRELSSNPELRRALIRGSIFDPDCCIRKGILAAGTSPIVEIRYPYISKRLVDFFEQLDSSLKFDYHSGVNKLLLRELLRHSGIQSSYTKQRKGSFRCDLSSLAAFYSPTPQLMDILLSIGITKLELERLHKASRSSFVSSQKLAFLYALDIYIENRGLHI
jgi:hypothetical protein